MAEYDSLPAVDGIDWEQAYNNLSDMDLLFTVINDFCTNAARDLNELNGFYDTFFTSGEDEAMENYRIKVHALKHSLALVGAQPMSDMARALEYASRDRDCETVKRDNGTFTAKYESLAENLAETFDIDTSAKVRAYNADELKDELEILKEAFDSFDIETLNDTMERIENFETGAELSSHISRLSDAVLTLDENDFEESMSAILNMIGN